MSDDMMTEEPVAFSFGKRLSTARSALNLSREEVSKSLHLGVDIITALENEDHQRLAAPIFVTGYIRNYAKLLKIPVEPLLDAYNKVQVEKPTIVANAIPKPSRSYNSLIIKIVTLLIIVGLVAGLVSWFQEQNYEPSTWFSSPNETENIQPAVVLPELDEPDELPSTSELNTEDTEAESTPEIGLDAVTDLEIVTDPESAIELEPAPVLEEANNPDKETAEAPVSVNKNEIIIDLTKDSWANIKDSTGKRLIYGLLKAEKQHRLVGEPPFKVVLGNAAGAKIEYNGELIDIKQHTQGNIARFQIGAAGE